MAFRFERGDLGDPRVIKMIQRHLARARAETAPGSAHALDHSGLSSPEVLFWTIWDKDDLVGMGALKRLEDNHFEVKSMYTAENRRREGIGKAILEHICSEAANIGAERLSLETGSWDYFMPAIALYLEGGFVECAPFAHYVEDPNSVFMTRSIT